MSGVLKPSHKITKLISNLVYVMLNITLAVMVIAVIDLFGSVWLAIVTIVLSKWRVFAVKIRFWWANIVANFVDFLVGLNYVLVIYTLGESQFVAQLVAAGLYVVWLLIIKPGTGRRMIMLQGLVTLLLSNAMLSIFGSNLAASMFVLIEMALGYHVMRHFLVNCEIENDNLRLISGAWALIMAELSWICWHWLIGYNLAWGLKLSQFSIISVLMTFVAYKILNYANSEVDSEQRALKVDMIISIIFAVLSILIMLMFFSRVPIV